MFIEAASEAILMKRLQQERENTLKKIFRPINVKPYSYCIPFSFFYSSSFALFKSFLTPVYCLSVCSWKDEERSEEERLRDLLL